jgi:CIC family chloride channel protein
MRAMDDEAEAELCRRLIEDGVFIEAAATLEAAMPIFERSNPPFIPVIRLVEDAGDPEIEGALYQVDALRAYNHALAARAAEEHS